MTKGWVYREKPPHMTFVEYEYKKLSEFVQIEGLWEKYHGFMGETFDPDPDPDTPPKEGV